MTKEERDAHVAVFEYTKRTTVEEAVPVIEEIADELGVKPSNGKVLDEFFKRYKLERNSYGKVI